MKQPYNTTIYNTALYMRLSRDDENYGDSVSIETQRTILQQYAKEQGLHVVGEYVDDVDAGKVNCIVTKDCCAIMGLNQKDLENQGILA